MVWSLMALRYRSESKLGTASSEEGRRDTSTATIHSCQLASCQNFQIRARRSLTGAAAESTCRLRQEQGCRMCCAETAPACACRNITVLELSAADAGTAVAAATRQEAVEAGLAAEQTRSQLVVKGFIGKDVYSASLGMQTGHMQHTT